MQSVDLNRILGEVEPFDVNKIEKMLKDPNIDHVDVFKGQEEIEHRKKLVGKKYKPRKYHVSKGYQKAPKINRKK